MLRLLQIELCYRQYQHLLWMLWQVTFSEKSTEAHARRFVDAGINGLMDPVEPGLACGSDTAHMNLFGYDPRKCAILTFSLTE